MNVLLLAPLSMVLGFLLDLLLGDPAWLYHPTRLIGKLITTMERFLRRVFPATRGGELAAGRVFSVAVPLLTLLVVQWLLLLAARVHVYLWFGLETFFCYQAIAAQGLRKESMAVYRELEKGDMPSARRQLSRIVGRDTKNLDEPGVVCAAVETVAENTTDGVVAPLLYMALGGAGLAWCYKAINTLDSMVGYKNETYLHVGRASALLDDAANYIPARLAALCLLAASLRYNATNARRVWARDKRNHASPNSAQTEAVVAGALGIRLAGDAVYFGQVVHKPTIGDAMRPAEREDIRRANALMLTAAGICLVLLCALRVALAAILIRGGA